MRTTSFTNMFRKESGFAIEAVEIPIIQRDYAQGRTDTNVKRIRQNFLAVLHGALTGQTLPVNLDFIYGDVTGNKLTPLDGQQRLTTLFLLHWYIAAKEGVKVEESDLATRFTYATRFSARAFCEQLVLQRPTFPMSNVSDWLVDQNWFLSSWRHDPSIRAMLVMVDAIHDLFKDTVRLWPLLTSVDNSPISFHLLPLEAMGLSDDLYVKMNSRGKPLTPFEHFKAEFEKLISEDSEPDYAEFSTKIDNEWTDLLWPFRGEDNIIDDEFMHYFCFVSEVLWCRTAQAGPVEGDEFVLAKKLYSSKVNQRAAENRRYLFDALDCWGKRDVGKLFDGLFAKATHETGKVRLFDSPVNLFEACCKSYGRVVSGGRVFSLQSTLLLFAVVEHLMHGTNDIEFCLRLRTLRNLAVNSGDEVRADKLGEALDDAATLISTGSLATSKAYNKLQLVEEGHKQLFLAANPSVSGPLFRLEDHTLLRGCLAAFDLDSATLTARGQAFADVFAGEKHVSLQTISGALLACGDYSQPLNNDNTRHQFACGGREAVWRDLFTRAGRPRRDATKVVLAKLLDDVSARGSKTSVPNRLNEIRTTYLSKREKSEMLNWRYYFVKYQSMREGSSGIYYWATIFGICMLEGTAMHGYYRDAYLNAVCVASGADMTTDIPWLRRWYRGYDERWMTLEKSGVKVACVNDGFQLQAPKDVLDSKTFRTICSKFGIGSDLLLRIGHPQIQGGEHYDLQDRVEVAARLVKALLAM